MSILKIKDQNNNWQSIPAMKGDPGVSPAVTVDTIQGGHQVTITDATHPQGQSFDVMDGQDGGLSDAPSDGKTYVRKDEEWVEGVEKSEVEELYQEINGVVIDTAFINIGKAYGSLGLETSSMFKCTDLLPFSSLKSYKHIQTGKAGNYHNVAFYDVNKAYLGYKDYQSAQSSTYQTLTYSDSSVPNGTMYVAFNAYASKDTANVIDMNPNTGLAGQINDVADLLDTMSKRTRVDILATDSEIDILDKLLYARNTTNCDVYWQPGMYNFTEVLYTELRSRSEFSSINTYELPLGGNCSYYFNGSTIIATLAAVSGYCNIFGTTRKNCGNFSMNDGILISNGCCYCVHDEGQSADGYYKHEYHNMRMIQNSTSETNDINKCIGGGTGKKGEVVIKSCTFTTNSNCPDDCSWHGCGQSVSATCTFDIVVCNSYFSKRFSLQDLIPSQSGSCLYSANSASAALYNYNNEWDVKEFCNEIRD